MLTWMPALALVVCSCTLEDEVPAAARISATFGLRSPSALDGKIVIGEAYLKLHRLEVTGTLNGSSVTQVNHTVAPEESPYRLTTSDSSHAGFALGSTTYDQLDLRLFPFVDEYELVYLGVNADPEPVADPDVGSDDEGPAEGSDEGGDETDPQDEGGEKPKSEGSDAGSDKGGSENKDDQSSGDEDDKEEDRKDEKEHKKDDKKSDDDKDKNKNKDKEKNKDKDKNKNKNKNKDKDKNKNNNNNKDKKSKKDKKDKKDKDRDDDDDDDDDRRSTSQVVDLDHFFQHAKPGLVVFGMYENNGKTISLIFVVTDVERLGVQARQDDNSAIRLEKNNTARVTFDPAAWFESVTPKDIEMGMIQTYQQQHVLFIHPDHNTALYKALVSRLEDAMDFEITAGSL